jgi:hypothetical protein
MGKTEVGKSQHVKILPQKSFGSTEYNCEKSVRIPVSAPKFCIV